MIVQHIAVDRCMGKIASRVRRSSATGGLPTIGAKRNGLWMCMLRWHFHTVVLLRKPSFFGRHHTPRTLAFQTGLGTGSGAQLAASDLRRSGRSQYSVIPCLPPEVRLTTVRGILPTNSKCAHSLLIAASEKREYIRLLLCGTAVRRFRPCQPLLVFLASGLKALGRGETNPTATSRLIFLVIARQALNPLLKHRTLARPSAQLALRSHLSPNHAEQNSKSP